MRIETTVTKLLNIDLPIIQAGMSWASSNSALPIAVSNAGGLGVLAAGPMFPHHLEEAIDEIKAGTNRPFAVNQPLYRQGADAIMDMLLEKRIPVLIASQGGPGKYIDRFRAAGTICLHVVSSELHAQKAVAAGVDGLIAVGGEAGGHPPPGLVSTLVLARAIAKAVPDFPLILSGGFADGYGLAAALSLGAGGAQFGSRFMMSREARLHPAYQEVLSKAGVDDTMVVGRGFGVIRIIRNQFAEDMAKAEADGLPEEIRKSIFDKSSLKAAAFDGNVERGKVEAGQSIGLVSTVLPAAQIVADIAQDYARALAGLTRPVVDHNLKEINHAG